MSIHKTTLFTAHKLERQMQNDGSLLLHRGYRMGRLLAEYLIAFCDHCAMGAFHTFDRQLYPYPDGLEDWFTLKTPHPLFQAYRQAQRVESYIHRGAGDTIILEVMFRSAGSSKSQEPLLNLEFHCLSDGTARCHRMTGQCADLSA